MSDEFTSTPSDRITDANPLIVGITAPSFGGKTFSSLELATGMASVNGGPVALIDTEGGRGRHYKNLFAYNYIPFKPPFSPLRYRLALEYAIKQGNKVIIVDSMTNEHSGEGGVLDQVEEYLTQKAGDDWKARERPKAQRSELNNYIQQIGADAMLILCYLANDKIKPNPKKGEEPIHLGWTAETTSTLPRMMTVRFLLPPASDGRPNLNPDTEFEKLSIKNPQMFREWFKPGLQLNRALGAKLAEWSLGKKAPAVGPLATKEQAEEILVEIRRLKWTKAVALEWLSQYGATTPAEIPLDRAIQALQDLMKRKDP